MNNPTGDALNQYAKTDAESALGDLSKVSAQTLLDTADYVSASLADDAAACSPSQLALSAKLLRARQIIEALLPLHRAAIADAKYKSAVSVSLQQTVDNKEVDRRR